MHITCYLIEEQLRQNKTKVIEKKTVGWKSTT